MHRFEHINFGAKQRGAALGVGLILLLAMTLSGVFILNSSIMDERMSANHRSQTNAFLAAEAGLLKSQRFLDDNWNAWSASSCVPGESASLFNDESYANDASFNVIGFDCSPQLGVTLRSEGFIDNLGVSRVLTARYEPPMPDGPGPGDAPAAISCLGGGCRLVAGNAANAKIDGRDHALPPDGCNGSSCWLNPITAGDAAPSIFLTDPAASNIAGGSNAGGGNEGSFCGLRVDGSATGCGRNNSTDQFWNPSLYPVDADGNPTVPTAEAFIDDSAMGQITADGASVELGTRSDPKVTYYDPRLTPDPPGNANNAGVLIVDGVDFNRNGTGTFEGLIIIRGCGSISLGGNFNVYGAVLVDARGCEDENGVYDPFSGNGTPSVRFSSEALAGASGLIPGGAGGLQNWAEEIQGL